MAQHQLLGWPIYGVSHDDPNITAPEKCCDDTWVAVDDDFVAHRGAQITTIPGGTRAALPFEGTPLAVRHRDSAGAAVATDMRPPG